MTALPTLPAPSTGPGAPELTPEVVAVVTWACGITALRSMAAEWSAIAESAPLAGQAERARDADVAVRWLRAAAQLAERQQPAGAPDEPVDLMLGGLVASMGDADCAVHLEAMRRGRPRG